MKFESCCPLLVTNLVFNLTNFVTTVSITGVFGFAVDYEKAAVNCELWKSYCELKIMR
jgi:hypothetical protein